MAKAAWEEHLAYLAAHLTVAFVVMARLCQVIPSLLVAAAGARIEVTVRYPHVGAGMRILKE